MNDNFESNESNSNNDENLNKSRLVDVRIVLTNLDYLEAISKAVNNFDLSNFNVNISSIIPSSNIEIVKNTIIDADLVLIACSYDSEGKKLYSNFKKALKTDYNFIEYLKLPSLDELEDYDYDYDEDNTFEDEIANSIIRAGLHSISNLSSINQSKRAYHKVKSDFDRSSLRFDKINAENNVLLNESKRVREKNEKLTEEIKILQRDLDSIKSDFSDLKSRFESIHSRNSLEVFSLMELWEDLFSESFTEEIYRFILISTDNFRPKNLMIGQGVICAESKEDALDWLKIIKTAFILNDSNKKELDFNNFNSNFKFEEISSKIFNSSSDSNSLTEDNSDIFNEIDSSDEFIYNERFEGKNNSESEFGQLNFNEDFDLNDDNQESFINNMDNQGSFVNDFDSQESFNIKDNDSQDSYTLDDFNDSYNSNHVDLDEFNVFNLKSLKNLKKEIDEVDSDEDDDYVYDDEEDLDDSEDLFNPFSNLWD